MEMTYKVLSETMTQQQYFTKLSSENNQCAGCKCKNNKCLKLYCVCLRNKATCGDECGCNRLEGDENCHNTVDRYTEREQAIKEILKRNIKAFEDKVDAEKSQHFRGCRCKASNC